MNCCECDIVVINKRTRLQACSSRKIRREQLYTPLPVLIGLEADVVSQGYTAASVLHWLEGGGW